MRSHSRKWPWRDWQPVIALVARIYLFCVGARDSRVASYWIDTLVLKNWGKYLRYFATSSLPLWGKPTQCSRGSSHTPPDQWDPRFDRRRSTQKSTYQVAITNPYLPHYIICHLPLVFLSPTSPLPFYSPSLFRSPLFRLLLACSCVGLLARHDDST